MDYLELTIIKGDNPGIRYVSNMNVCIDRLYDGRVLPVGRSSTGRPKYQCGNAAYESPNWIGDFIGREEVESFILEIDGHRLENHWLFRDAYEVDEEGDFRHGVMALQHDLRPVRVEVHTRICGSSFFERWLVVENTGDRPAALSYIAPAAGIVMTGEGKGHGAGVFDIVYFDDDRFCFEGSLVSKALPAGTFSYGSKTGRSGWGAPFAMITNSTTGETFASSLEWASNWSFEATTVYPPQGENAALLFSIGPRASAPIKVIRPGGKLVSPVVHFGAVRGGIDECARQFHIHIRRSVVEQGSGRDFLPVTGGRVVEGGREWWQHEVDMAAMMGMECFIMDAGWYGYGNGAREWFTTVGDWNVKEWFNIEEVREYIHSKGMKFGLWIEPECAGSDSRLIKEHPGWAMSRGAETVANGRLLDLSKPEVREWVRETIISIIETHKPDMIKIDYNSHAINDLGENEESGYYENAMWGHVQALYDIFDEIRARYPGLYLENCSSGGGRSELGLMRRFDVLCHSDYTVTPRSLYAAYNLSYIFPPELMRYYFAHWRGYHRNGDYEFQIRAAMLINPLFVGFGLAGDPVNLAEKEKITRHVSLYKNFIRPMMKDCRAYHHTGVLEFNKEHDWCVMEYGAQDGAKSVIYIFKLQSTGEAGILVRPKGIVPGHTYRVSRENLGSGYTASGGELLSRGIYIGLDGGYTSELVFIEAVYGTVNDRSI